VRPLDLKTDIGRAPNTIKPNRINLPQRIDYIKLSVASETEFAQGNAV
jgi:hypothetical protein